MVTEICGEDELDLRLGEVARCIATKPPEAVMLTKRLLSSTDASIPERMAEEGRMFEERLRSAEAREAFTAFFEKRPPNFG